MHLPLSSHFYCMMEKRSKNFITPAFAVWFIAGLVVFQFYRICRVQKEEDTKVTNAAIFTVNKEDHTLGNMIRQYVSYLLNFVQFKYKLLFVMILFLL